MRLRPRLLPALIAAALGLLVVKGAALWSAGGALVESARAQQTPTPTAAAPAPPAVAAPAAPAKEASAVDITKLSPTEIKILENLAKRRDEIAARAQALDLREKLLTVTEKRVDEKIAELKKVQAAIEGLIGRFDDREEARIKNLVGIYEKMKPKDAARIFDRLDIDILLSVVKRMRGAKAAAILAKMDAGKAKEVTVRLAERRQIPPSLVDAGKTAAP